MLCSGEIYKSKCRNADKNDDHDKIKRSLLLIKGGILDIISKIYLPRNEGGKNKVINDVHDQIETSQDLTETDLKYYADENDNNYCLV